MDTEERVAKRKRISSVESVAKRTKISSVEPVAERKRISSAVPYEAGESGGFVDESNVEPFGGAAPNACSYDPADLEFQDEAFVDSLPHSFLPMQLHEFLQKSSANLDTYNDPDLLILDNEQLDSFTHQIYPHAFTAFPQRMEIQPTNSLVFISYVVNESYGDISVGAKVITALKKKYPEITFSWIVYDGNTSQERSKRICQNVECSYFIIGPNDSISSEAITKIQNANATLLLAGSNYLGHYTFHLIQHFSRKCIFINEYDKEVGEDSYLPQGIERNSSGLGLNSLGIFYTDPKNVVKPLALESLGEEIQPFLKDAAPNNIKNPLFFGYFNLEPQEARDVNCARRAVVPAREKLEVSFWGFSPKGRSDSYPDRRLASADFKADCTNDSTQSLMSTGNSLDQLPRLPAFSYGKLYSPGNFIKICLSIIPDQDLFLLMRFPNPKEHPSFMEELQKQCPLVNFQIKCVSENFEKKIVAGDGKRTIYLYDLFPLSHEQMLYLLYHSNLFCGVTGDQSMSEALSFGKLPLYQIMGWKKDFFQQTVRVAKTVDADLGEFYEMQQDFSKPEFTENFSDFLAQNSEKLKAKQATFTQEIQNKYNLVDNMDRKIKKYRSQPDPFFYSIVGLFSLLVGLALAIAEFETECLGEYFSDNPDPFETSAAVGGMAIATVTTLYLFKQLPSPMRLISQATNFPGTS